MATTVWAPDTSIKTAYAQQVYEMQR